HTQRALVEISRRAQRRVLLCAPTGKAARRMRDLTGHDAMTIHRALGYSPNEGGFRRDERWPLSRDYDLIIVDEASMLSLELADDFFFIARHGPESLLETVVELVCDRIPARYGLDPRTEVMTLVPMRPGPVGLIALNEELERRLNPGDPRVVLARSGLRVGS